MGENSENARSKGIIDFDYPSMRPIISTILSWLMKCSCFWRGRAFVRPSAAMSLVEAHSILIFPACTSWRSQCWVTSIWRSFVTSLGASFVIRRMVWRLSHKAVRSSSISKSILTKKRPHYRSQAQTWAKAKSSASVVDVVTVDCLMHFQSIVPPNSWNKYPSVLQRVETSSAYEASLAAIKTRCPSIAPPNSSA